MNSSRARAVAREVLLFLFFLALTLVFTWPLVRVLDTGTSDLGDPLLNAWIVNWDHYAVTHGHLHDIFQAPMFVPAKYALAYSENLFGVAAVVFPFYLAGLPPLVVYNIAFLLGFAFCGYGASVLARVVTKSMTAGIVAGILYAFTGFHWDHIAHLQFIWAGWLPLMLAALIAYWRRPTKSMAACFGAALLMNGLCNVHYLLFGTFATVITILMLAVWQPQRSIRFWATLAVAFAAALLLLLPVLWPYHVVSVLYDMKRSEGDALFGSGNWSDWLMPTLRSKTYGPSFDPAKWVNEHAIFPGLMSYLLAIAAFVLLPREPRPEQSPRPKWLLHGLDLLIVIAAVWSYFSADPGDLWFVVAIVLVFIRFSLQLPRALADVWRGTLPPVYRVGIVWIAIGVIGSLGMHAFLHRFLYYYATPFQSIRAVVRWGSAAYVGFIVTNAYGVVALRRISRWLALLMIPVALWEVRPILRWENALPDVDDVYQWMRVTPAAAPFLEIPVSEQNAQYFYVYAATYHHQPIANGVSGFEPPPHARINALYLQPKLTPELTAAIVATGTRTIVVHEDWLRAQGPAVHQWLTQELAAGRLRFLRRFDHWTSGDYVFAVTRNCPQCDALRAPHVHDAAGMFPEEELARMLHGQSTYSDKAFGILDTPHAWETIPGRQLTIAGWAMSPYGVQQVDALLQCRTVRKRATLVRRGDIAAMYPWYPGPYEGFTLTLPKRPRGVSKYTDVQIEITDGLGRKTRLPDVLIKW